MINLDTFLSDDDRTKCLINTLVETIQTLRDVIDKMDDQIMVKDEDLKTQKLHVTLCDSMMTTLRNENYEFKKQIKSLRQTLQQYQQNS